MICRFFHANSRREHLQAATTLALTATTLSLLVQGCLTVDDPTFELDTDSVPEETGDGTDAGDASSGPCTRLDQSDVDRDLELAAGCYEVETLLSIDGTSFSMGPGVEVTFGQFGGLIVSQGGVLRGIGDPNDPIVLRGQTESRGSWQGLRFIAAASSENRLENVELYHAGGGGGASAAAVSLSNGARLTVDQSTISQSAGFAISAEGSELRVDRSTIESNAAALSVNVSTVAGIGDDNIFENNDRNVVVITGGTLSTNATWQAVGIPYHPVANLAVRGELTLAPGVTLAMAKEASLIVGTDGQLRAEGTAAAPITLTGQQAEVSFWKGLSVESKSSNNVLDHCIVEYGGATRWTGNNDTRAMIFQPEQSKLTVRNTTLRHSGWYAFFAARSADIAGFEQNRLENNVRAMIVNPDLAGSIAPSNAFENNDEQRVRVGFSNLDRLETAQTWRALDVPYYVVDRFTVRGAWSIEAGATIEVAQEVRIVVDDGGSITAMGTSASPVVFTGADSVAGYWVGLQVATLSSANRLEHTVVDYAGGTRWHGGADSEAALYVGGAGAGSLALSNATVRNSAGNGILVANDSSTNCSGVSFQNIAKLNVAGPGAGPC